LPRKPLIARGRTHAAGRVQSRRAGASLILFASVGIALILASSFSAQAQTGSGPSVLYNKSLEGSGDLPSVDTQYCHQAYESNGYLVQSSLDVGCNAPILPVGVLPAHARIEVSVLLQKGDANADFGIYFGYTGAPDQDYYRISLTASGQFSVAYFSGGNHVFPFPPTTDEAVKQGSNASNRIAVEIMGPRAQFFINGKEVGSILAKYPIVGAIGFSILHVEQVVFSGLVVTDLAPGTPSGAVAPPPATSGQQGAGSVILDQSVWTNADWGASGSCKVTFAIATLTIQNGAQKGFCIVPLVQPSSVPAHVRIELTLSLLAGATDSDIGFSFGGHYVGNDYYFYLFGVDGNGSFDVTSRTAAWNDIKPWTRSSYVNSGYNSVNTMAVEIHGTSFSYSVNGQVLGNVTATASLDGQVGLYLNAPGMKVQFDHMRITDLGQ
jgi:hypothetical protein